MTETLSLIKVDSTKCMANVILKKTNQEQNFDPMLQKVRQLYEIEHPEIFNKKESNSSNKFIGALQ